MIERLKFPEAERHVAVSRNTRSARNCCSITRGTLFHVQKNEFCAWRSQTRPVIPLKRLPIFVSLMLLFCAVFSTISMAGTLTVESPPDIQKGWNIISTPCSVPVKSISRKVLSDMNYYIWDGSDYAEAAELERGVGYLVHSNIIANTTDICETHVTDPITINLRPGWNLIGNPYKKSIPILEIFAGHEEDIESIFEYRGHKFVELDIDGRFKPWRGYWVYVSKSFSVTTVESCQIDINYTIAETGSPGRLPARILLIENIYLHAYETCMLDGESKTTEVTNSVEWQLSPPEMGSVEGNVFTAGAAAGEATVTATMDGIESNEIGIDVLESIECSALSHGFEFVGENETAAITKDSGDLTLIEGDAGYFRVSEICHEGSIVHTRDVAQFTEWKLSNTKPISIADDAAVTALSMGDSTVTGTVNGTPIPTATVTVLPRCRKLVLVQGAYKASFHAQAGTDAGFTTKNLPEPAAGGNWCISCTGEEIHCSDTAANWYENASLFNIHAICVHAETDDSADFSVDGTTFVDVTDLVTWEIENEDVLKYYSGTFHTENFGTTTVSADYRGLTKGSTEIAVAEAVVDKLELETNELVEMKIENVTEFHWNPINISGSKTFRAIATFVLPEDSALTVCNRRTPVDSDIRSSTGDVTTRAEWSVLDSDAVSLWKNGHFDGEKVGSADVKATYRGKSADARIDVLKTYYGPSLSAYSSKTRADTNDIIGLYAHYTDYDSRQDVSNEVEWTWTTTSGNPKPVIDGNILDAGPNPGAGYVRARYKGLTSPGRYIEILSGARIYIVSIYFEEPGNSFAYMKPGTSVQLRAKAMYYINDYTPEDAVILPGSSYATLDISDRIDWTRDINIRGRATISETGLLTTGAESTSGYITLYYEGTSSSRLYYDITDDSNPVAFAILPTRSQILAAHSSINIETRAAFVQDDICLLRQRLNMYGSNPGCDILINTVTDQTVFSFDPVPPQDSVSIQDGVLYAGEVEYQGYLRGYYMGISDNTHIKVNAATDMMMLIAESESQRRFDCPAGYCYLMKTGEYLDISLTAYRDANLSTSKYSIDNSLVTWEVSDPSIATVSSEHIFAKKPGTVWLRGNCMDARSDKTQIIIYDNEHTDFLITGITSDWMYKPVKPILASENASLVSVHYRVDPGGCTDYAFTDFRQCLVGYNTTSISGEYVTDDSVFTSTNTAAATFDDTSPGTLTGISPGFTTVYATYNEMTGNKTDVEVWDYHDVHFCDPANPNRGEWESEHSKAILETDCRSYAPGGKVGLRYTALVDEDLDQYLDNCLDLYIMDESGNIVKTLRDEGCSTETLGRTTARTLQPAYQFFEEWDMTDDGGTQVAPGRYYATARFYILWDPIIKVPIDIIDPSAN